MNKLKFFIILVVLAFSVSVVGAVERHSLSVEEALKPIFEAQAVDNVSKIDCEKITDDDSEMLGDAVMEEMLGSSEQHEIMDEMMGGEGSASLKAAHKNMGLRYLGCAGADFGQGMMFGSGMMNMMGMGNWSNFNNLRNYVPMMGNFGFNNMMGWGWGWSLFGWVTMILFWVLLVVAIVALVKWLLADKNKKR